MAIRQKFYPYASKYMKQYFISECKIKNYCSSSNDSTMKHETIDKCENIVVYQYGIILLFKNMLSKIIFFKLWV